MTRQEIDRVRREHMSKFKGITSTFKEDQIVRAKIMTYEDIIKKYGKPGAILAGYFKTMENEIAEVLDSNRIGNLKVQKYHSTSVMLNLGVPNNVYFKLNNGGWNISLDMIESFQIVDYCPSCGITQLTDKYPSCKICNPD